MEHHNRELTDLYGAEPVELDAACNELFNASQRLGPMLKEVGPEIYRHAEAGDPILFEGAQGVLLDLTWGTYPFVTSSSCLPGSAATSCGISPKLLGPVVGIMKAYVTRVGGGPFPSELEDADGERLRERGVEFGTTTGRPRRCGWFDAVAARYAVQVAGIDALAVMKLDVLDGFNTLKVVVGYQLPDGTRVDTLPADPDLVAKLEPIHEEVPGWQEPTEGVTDYGALPPAAVRYLEYMEKLVGVPIVLVSTGPRREETLACGGSGLAKRLAGLIHGNRSS
jgi:adenylosuccinate synthase